MVTSKPRETYANSLFDLNRGPHTTFASCKTRMELGRKAGLASPHPMGCVVISLARRGQIVGEWFSSGKEWP